MLILIFGTLIFCGLSHGYPLKSNDTNFDYRIHGGVDAPPGFAPHMVALLSGDVRVSIVCGGSIVTKMHVMTAAHCITPFVEDNTLVSTFHGRVGSNIWHSDGHIINFQKHFVHPKWDENTIKYDVGVLKLTKDLIFSNKVSLVGLDFGWVGGDHEMFVTGWGRTEMKIVGNAVNLAPIPDELQLHYARTMTPGQCSELMASSEDWLAVAPFIDPKLEICTFHSVGRGVCHGDSGSALVSVKTGKQNGLVSWGMPCAVGAPDVYTRLFGVADFLIPIIKRCSRATWWNQ